MKIGLFSAAALAALALSGVAFAQAPAPAVAPVATTTTRTNDYTEQRTEGSQVVTFGGDRLDGDPKGIYGDTIRRPPGVLRAQLIRPRMNFVSELLKSVENL